MPDITLLDPFAEPGMGTPIETTEYEPFAGQAHLRDFRGVVLASTTVDARNSGATTTLLPGLILGQITATLKFVHYSPTATDGSQVAQGYLLDGVNMLDNTGVAAEKIGRIVEWAVLVKNGSLGGLDAVARAQLKGFTFDDDWQGYKTQQYAKEVAKTADYTVTAADRGTMFTNTGAVGAVNFTLPTRAAGLEFAFKGVADQNITVTSAAGTDIVTFNNASASSVAYSTAGNKIGGMFRVTCNHAGTKWYVEAFGSNTVTVA